MNAKIFIKKDHAEASAFAAQIAAEKFMAKPEMTVTFAAGDTPFKCYERLIAMQARGELRLDLAHYIGLDEWLGLGPGDRGSCIEAMNRGFYIPAGIPREHIEYFNGLADDPQAEAGRMRGVLERCKGIDLAILGIGVNGHVGFNEPGPAAAGGFSLVPLSESTKTVGRKYFGGGKTPEAGATITLNALKQAGAVIIIATGETKRAAIADILSGSRSLPAGAFLDHEEAYYIFDEAGAE